MELKNEPRLSQEHQLVNVVVVGSAMAGILALMVFFFEGVLSSLTTKAANVVVNDAAIVRISEHPFGGLYHGDTIFIYGKCYVDEDFTSYARQAITVVVDGMDAELKVFSDRHLQFGEGSSLLLMNGGSIYVEGKCSDRTSIYFGTEEVANCSGSMNLPAFNEVSKAGGIGADGTLFDQNLHSFSLKEINSGKVLLNWSVFKKTNHSYFEVEYSFNGLDWKIAETIKPLKQSLSYRYTHEFSKTSERVYYRIKQIAADQTCCYSLIRAI